MSDTDPVQVEPVTPRQVKAARALLGWSQLQLGLRSDTSIHVVRTFEQTGRVMTVQRRPDLTDPLGAIRATLEKAGVEFNNENAPGVRLRKPVP
jgi:ribosome-binding protein aMBF1 (putative translation factor)